MNHINNPTLRFSDRVQDYINYRPHYPKEIIDFLKSEIGLLPTWNIADIGSGTGISSKLFLDANNPVYAVEPNKEMREAAAFIFSSNKLFHSIDGKAEETHLSSHSIDLIIVGQAFHWFDAIAFKKECKRIAKTNAYCLLLWNERLSNTPFLNEYDQLVNTYATDKTSANHRLQIDELIGDFFAPNFFQKKIFPNQQLFNFDSLKGRLLSSSYAPNKAHPQYSSMIDELQQIFNTHQINNEVCMNYNTSLYYALL